MRYVLINMMVLGLLAAPLCASVVALDAAVDGGTSPVTIGLGETVEVRIYATVTDNDNLGLAGYGVSITSSGRYLGPVGGAEWNVTFAVPAFTLQARGNVIYDDVWGNGAGFVLPPYTPDDIAAESRTLLAYGRFRGVSLGQTTIVLASGSANAVNAQGGADAAGSIVLEGGAQVTVVPASVPGDADRDGDVDLDDLSTLASHWNTTTGMRWGDGDFDDDDDVDLDDLSALAANWQYGVTGAVQVPEPACLAVLAAGLAGLRRRRRRRHQPHRQSGGSPKENQCLKVE